MNDAPNTDRPADTTLPHLVAVGTSVGGLPATVERACCPGKSCGDTTLELKVLAAVVDGQVQVTYTYVRQSNGDHYWRSVQTVDELIEKLNDPACWPQDEAAQD